MKPSDCLPPFSLIWRMPDSATKLKIRNKCVFVLIIAKSYVIFHYISSYYFIAHQSNSELKRLFFYIFFHMESKHKAKDKRVNLKHPGGHFPSLYLGINAPSPPPPMPTSAAPQVALTHHLLDLVPLGLTVTFPISLCSQFSFLIHSTTFCQFAHLLFSSLDF